VSLSVSPHSYSGNLFPDLDDMMQGYNLDKNSDPCGSAHKFAVDFRNMKMVLDQSFCHLLPKGVSSQPLLLLNAYRKSEATKARE